MIYLLLILLTKVSALEGELQDQPACITNKSTRVTHGVKVTSLSASFQQKTRVTTDHECQIALNRK
jgi:hypothetical protein